MTLAMIFSCDDGAPVDALPTGSRSWQPIENQLSALPYWDRVERPDEAQINLVHPAVAPQGMHCT
jgi:hypothetical protein